MSDSVGYYEFFPGRIIGGLGLPAEKRRKPRIHHSGRTALLRAILKIPEDECSLVATRMLVCRYARRARYDALLGWVPLRVLVLP